MKDSLLDTFPILYRQILPPAVFLRKMEKEKTADCGNCIMCETKGTLKAPSVSFFSPNTKCCTYQPAIPNYLVGALLSDDSGLMEEGKRRIRDKIKSKVDVIPKGVWVSDKYLYLYKAAVEHEQTFGKADSMKCTYLQEGNCTVWKYRNAICSTWFCKSDHGVDGTLFWQAVKNYMRLVEEELVHYLLFKSGYSGEQILPDNSAEKGLSPRMMDEKPLSDKAYSQLWGRWAGMEEAFYIWCYEEVKTITPDALVGIVGVKGEILLKTINEKLDVIDHHFLPHLLRRNQRIQFELLEADQCTIVVEDKPYQLPFALYNSLVYFNGKEGNHRVLERIKKEAGIEVKEDLLLYLYRTRILISN